MNAPLTSGHLLPHTQARDVPAALIDALRQRFGAQLSTAQVVREQHGRDESAFSVAPPEAVVFARSRPTPPSEYTKYSTPCARAKELVANDGEALLTVPSVSISPWSRATRCLIEPCK